MTYRKTIPLEADDRRRLSKLARTNARASEQAERARQERDALILKLLDRGVSMRALAEASGVSLARVGQLAQER